MNQLRHFYPAGHVDDPGINFNQSLPHHFVLFQLMRFHDYQEPFIATLDGTNDSWEPNQIIVLISSGCGFQE